MRHVLVIIFSLFPFMALADLCPTDEEAALVAKKRQPATTEQWGINPLAPPKWHKGVFRMAQIGYGGFIMCTYGESSAKQYSILKYGDAHRIVDIHSAWVGNVCRSFHREQCPFQL